MVGTYSHSPLQVSKCHQELKQVMLLNTFHLHNSLLIPVITQAAELPGNSREYFLADPVSSIQSYFSVHFRKCIRNFTEALKKNMK